MADESTEPVADKLERAKELRARFDTLASRATEDQQPKLKQGVGLLDAWIAKETARREALKPERIGEGEAAARGAASAVPGSADVIADVKTRGAKGLIPSEGLAGTIARLIPGTQRSEDEEGKFQAEATKQKGKNARAASESPIAFGAGQFGAGLAGTVAATAAGGVPLPWLLSMAGMVPLATGVATGAGLSAAQGYSTARNMGASEGEAGKGAAISGAVGGLTGLIPGVKGLVARPFIGAGAGAAGDVAGRALSSGGKHFVTAEEGEPTTEIAGVPIPTSFLLGTGFGALGGAGSALAERGQRAIRNPHRASGQAIAQIEKTGGKTTVMGPKLPKELEARYPKENKNALGMAAKDAANEVLDYNFEKDVKDARMNRAEEKILGRRSDEDVPLPDRHRQRLLEAARDHRLAGESSQNDKLPGSNKAHGKLEKWEKWLSEGPVAETGDYTPGDGPRELETRQPSTDVPFESDPRAEKISRERTAREERKDGNPAYNHPRPDGVEAEIIPPGWETLRDGDEKDVTPPAKTPVEMRDVRQLTRRDLVKLRRRLDLEGKVGRAAGFDEKPFKELAKVAREELHQADPDGYADLYSREHKQLKAAETRNEALGLQAKPRIAKSPKKVETVAGRLASLGGDDTRVAAREQNIEEIAAARSPKLKEKLKDVRAVEARELLSLTGRPLSIGLFGGKTGAKPTALGRLAENAPTAAAGRLDALIRGGGKLRLPIPLMIAGGAATESERRERKKKKEEGEGKSE